MHIVHYNSKYRKFEEAVKHKDGLAVLAVLIEETDKNNANFLPIIDSFKDVGEEGMTAQLHTAFPMMKILPNTDGFYRYSGSLVFLHILIGLAYEFSLKETFFIHFDIRRHPPVRNR